MSDLIRREFITLIVGAAAWPLEVRAQPPAMPVIGFLNNRSAETSEHLVAAFRRGLSEGGFVEGHNVVVDYRYTQGQRDLLPARAADLVQRRVAVIAAGPGADLAAKAATTTIPIVFVTGGDPVQLGLVASLNRPGGNLTGVTMLAAELEAKRIGLLHELVPEARAIGLLVDPNAPIAAYQVQEVQAAGHNIGVPIRVVSAASERDFEAAFAAISREGTGALMVAASSYFNIYHDRLVALAARHRLPTIFELREITEAGGLMSYAPSVTGMYHQLGVYVGRVLKGERPAELPVQRPTRFELVINLKTARALGLEVPATLLARADEVIE
jgi:putative tryptophan/tyrosine transport system substrate-binding protein